VRERKTKRRYLHIETLNRIAGLEMRARQVIEGLLSGLHRSPYLGDSPEFVQHRGYVPGDDTRRIDWRIYARNERYVVKQFREETNFVATVLLDVSASMQYGREGETKLDWGCFLTAALACLILRQLDAVSLATFDEKIITYVPPRTRVSSLMQLADRMEEIEARSPGRIASVLGETARRISNRGIVVLISDCLEDEAAIGRALAFLRFARHETVVFQVLHADEMEFPFTGYVRFVGLEGESPLVVEARPLREAYLNVLHESIQRIRAGCRNAHADYVLASTQEAIDRLLLRYLSARGKSREVRR
jgi:uncharacterized protein (DUF58 family)